VKLSGKIALITGAAAGIGRAAAILFAQQGASIVLLDADESANRALAAELAASGASASAITADVSSQPSVEAAVDEALRKFGRLDILFNNAGIVPAGKLHELSPEDWDRTLAVNLTSVFLLCRTVLPHFLSQGSGVILNTASATALRSVPDRAAYSATKAAIVSLTRSMALDYARDGIRVNCLCPGTIDTPSLRKRVAAQGDFEKAWSGFVARQPLQRLGTAEEVALAALYLASDDAAFVTGSALQIDGGMSA
jgi:NAD(P)-dependent dehydrogenase (short-subunit alcohol dehydrogenase family)